MRMQCSLIFFISVLCILITTGTAQEDDDDLLRHFRFNERERSCNYRRQQGFCRRRNECNKPTRRICRYGLPPIVCCLDEHEPTTTRRPITTKAPVTKPNSIKKIDLTFLGCGSRAPKVQHNSETNSNFGFSNWGRGFFSRRGKRSKSFREDNLEADSSRRKRQIFKPVIVGGVTAQANSWPWMVAIFKETSPRAPKRFLCGASLISRRYVLSAAHCFDGEKGDIDPSKFFVVVGSHTTKEGTEYNVQNILIHENYKTRQYYNDISLLRIGKEVTLTKKVYPVCVPSDGLRDKIQAGNNNVTVTGWGDTSFGGISSKVLQELTIPIVPLKECNASYSKLSLSNFPKGITNLFICAGVEEGGKDACQGDSGGPLVNKLKDNSYVQLGVVSFGYGCAQPGFPGVYTRISEYTKWLYDNTDLGK